MGFLIGWLCAVLPLWAVDDLNTWCEHRLIAAKRDPMFFASFQHAIQAGADEFPARPARHALQLGLRKFGVEDPNARLSLTVKPGTLNRESINIVLSADDRIVYKSLVKMPPLYVWKQFDEQETAEIVGYPESEDRWQIYGVGLVLESSFQSRKFVEMRRERTGGRKLVLGVDVDCDFLHLYSDSPRPRRYLMFREGFYLCRIPLIEADLPEVFGPTAE